MLRIKCLKYEPVGDTQDSNHRFYLVRENAGISRLSVSQEVPENRAVYLPVANQDSQEAHSRFFKPFKLMNCVNIPRVSQLSCVPQEGPSYIHIGMTTEPVCARMEPMTSVPVVCMPFVWGIDWG